MKTKLFLVGIVILGMMSCKGSSGKKVYEEGKVAIERAYKEYSESNAKKYYRMKNMEDKYEWLKEQMATKTPCYQCQGWGVVAYVDAYGNFIELDAYGNPVGHTCPVCGGSGTN